MLQKHYSNLEALALDMLSPEPIEDLTSISCVLNCLKASLVLFISLLSDILYVFLVPKVKMMDERLGPLVQEFKDLVYPPDYNPEGKPAAKRKPGKISDFSILI